MSRYKFSTLLAGALLLLGGCASDEFTWRGREVTGDQVMITLHRADFDRAEAGTRSVDPGTDIKDLSLVVFKADGTGGEIIPIEKEQIDGSGKDGANNDIFAVSLPYDQVAGKGGHWYFFANAKTELTAWASKAGATKNETTLSEIVFSKESQWDAASATGKNAVLFTPPINMDEGYIKPGEVLNNTISTPLKRIYGKIDLKINLTGKSSQAAYNLQVTGVALLQKSPDFGDIKGTPATAPAEATELSQLTWIEPTGQDIYSGSSVAPSKSLLKDAKLTMRSFPLAKDISSTNPDVKKVLMIIRGRYQDGELDENGNVAKYTDHDVYYAVPVDGIAPNQNWTATITGVGSAGSQTLNEAVKNQSGVSVVFEDNTADITSMVSDGENALAVGDTILVNSTGKQVVVNGTPQNVFTVRFRVSDQETAAGKDLLQYECIDESGNVVTKPDWMSFINPAVTQESSANNLKWFRASFRVNLAENNGTDRECRYRFKLKDRETMAREVLFLQQAPANFNATSDAFSISLGISGAATVDNKTIADYGKFVKTSNVPDGSSICYGIAPDNNGGRIRNEGLHIPMPNDDAVTYTYTVKVNTEKVKGNYTLTKSPNFPSSLVTITGSPLTGTLSSTTSWTVTCKTSGNYDYKVYRDALVLKVGDSEYSLDLYHTGFFHQVNGKWGYYEVFTVPSTGSHWLDRNLGARAAGMAVNNNGTNLTGVWPISTGSEGDYFARGNVSGQMPKGWNLPSYGNFEAIFSQPEFTVIANNATGGTSYTAPSFSFTSKEVDRNNKPIDSAPKTIRAYFPCARYKQSGNFQGGSKTGYYMTSTQSSGTYYQVAMFQGMNMISTTLNLDGSLTLPVRPMISPSGVTGSRMYECNVLGYTHVALYAYNKATGLKTWLTTWPGEQVVPYSADMLTSATGPLTVSKHFQKQVYYDYESNPDIELRVIFNICDNQGNVTHSNMVSESASTSKPYVGTPVASELTAHSQKRDGIVFHHGATYARGTGTVAPGAKNGDWSGGTQQAAQIVITYPRLVKDNAIYNYIYLRNKSNAAVTYNGSGKQSTAGLYRGKEIAGGYYQVTLYVPYAQEKASSINENYLIGLIGNHSFYKAYFYRAPEIISENQYGSIVSWPSASTSGIKYVSYNEATKTLNVTVGDKADGAIPTPATKPTTGTIYYKASDGCVPQNGGADVYITCAGGTSPINRQIMTIVSLGGETWYKYENVSLNNTGLQVYSYNTNDNNRSNDDRRNIKEDYEATNSTVLYYYLDKDDDWKLKPYTNSVGTEQPITPGQERTYRIYWKWSNGWAQDRDYIYVYSDGDYNVLPEGFTSGSVYPKSGESNGKAYIEFKSKKTNLKFKFIVKKNNGTGSNDWELKSGDWTVESFTENNGIWENIKYQDTW